MSFLLDVILLVILLAVVVLYAKRSIFGALTGVIALTAAAVAAVFLTGMAAPVLEQNVMAPLVERGAANELADMYSAPHLSSGRQTVAELPLGELVEQEPDAYIQLLNEYSVSPAAVRVAYEASPRPDTVLIAMTAARAAAFSQALAFGMLTVLLTLLLRLIAHRVEQNFPPAARYHGVRRLVPGVLGVPAGLVVLWIVVVLFQWLVPVVQGQILFVSENTLDAADWFSLLRRCDPFLRLM